MGLENTDIERPIEPAFAIEKVLRPYFKKKKYFFATEYEEDGGYKVDSIKFGYRKNFVGWYVKIKYGSKPYEENIEIALDEILVFVFEYKNIEDAK